MNETIKYEFPNQKIVEVLNENEKLKAEIKDKEQFEEINEKNKAEFENLHHLKSHIEHLQKIIEEKTRQIQSLEERCKEESG